MRTLILAACLGLATAGCATAQPDATKAASATPRASMAISNSQARALMRLPIMRALTKYSSL